MKNLSEKLGLNPWQYSRIARLGLHDLRRLVRETQVLFRGDTIVLGVWLETGNNGFGGQSPIDVIEAGGIDRVWRVLHQLRSGEPS
jgi:hypothetical protein